MPQASRPGSYSANEWGRTVLVRENEGHKKVYGIALLLAKEIVKVKREVQMTVTGKGLYSDANSPV